MARIGEFPSAYSVSGDGYMIYSEDGVHSLKMTVSDFTKALGDVIGGMGGGLEYWRETDQSIYHNHNDVFDNTFWDPPYDPKYFLTKDKEINFTLPRRVCIVKDNHDSVVEALYYVQKFKVNNPHEVEMFVSSDYRRGRVWNRYDDGHPGLQIFDESYYPQDETHEQHIERFYKNIWDYTYTAYSKEAYMDISADAVSRDPFGPTEIESPWNEYGEIEPWSSGFDYTPMVQIVTSTPNNISVDTELVLYNGRGIISEGTVSAITTFDELHAAFMACPSSTIKKNNIIMVSKPTGVIDTEDWRVKNFREAATNILINISTLMTNDYAFGTSFDFTNLINQQVVNHGKMYGLNVVGYEVRPSWGINYQDYPNAFTLAGIDGWRDYYSYDINKHPFYTIIETGKADTTDNPFYHFYYYNAERLGLVDSKYSSSAYIYYENDDPSKRIPYGDPHPDITEENGYAIRSTILIPNEQSYVLKRVVRKIFTAISVGDTTEDVKNDYLMYCGFKDINKEITDPTIDPDDPESDPDYQNNDPIDPVELQYRVTKEGKVFCTDIVNSVTGESLMGDVSEMNQEILEIASRIPECSNLYNGRVLWAENGEWAPGPKLSRDYVLSPFPDYVNAKVIAESPAGETYTNLTYTTEENGIIFEEGPRLYHEDVTLENELCTTKLDFESGDFYYLGNLSSKVYTYGSCSLPVGANQTIAISKDNVNAHSKIWFIPFRLLPVNSPKFYQPYHDLDNQTFHNLMYNSSSVNIKVLPTTKETAIDVTCDYSGILCVRETISCMLHIIVNNSDLEIVRDVTAITGVRDRIYLPVNKGDKLKLWITDPVGTLSNAYLGIVPFVEVNTAASVYSPVMDFTNKTTIDYKSQNSNRRFNAIFDSPSILYFKRYVDISTYNYSQYNNVGVVSSNSWSGGDAYNIFPVVSGNFNKAAGGYLVREHGTNSGQTYTTAIYKLGGLNDISGTNPIIEILPLRKSETITKDKYTTTEDVEEIVESIMKGPKIEDLVSEMMPEAGNGIDISNNKININSNLLSIDVGRGVGGGTAGTNIYNEDYSGYSKQNAQKGRMINQTASGNIGKYATYLITYTLHVRNCTDLEGCKINCWIDTTTTNTGHYNGNIFELKAADQSVEVVNGAADINFTTILKLDANNNNPPTNIFFMMTISGYSNSSSYYTTPAGERWVSYAIKLLAEGEDF